jgi:hypothetical protein
MDKSITQGKCYLCGQIFDKKLMTKHLKSCLKKLSLSQQKKTSTDTIKLFHVIVEGKYEPEYWMHLATRSDAYLYDLDNFLRDIWLECCNHLSAFYIGENTYLSQCSQPCYDKEEEMDIKLKEILKPKLKFTHEYDFGSTTELKLRVMSEYESESQKESIRIIARNEALLILCDVCGKKATRVCGSCMGINDEAWFCDKCAEKHDCSSAYLLPIANSPRVGVCGYCGEED